MNSPDQMKKTGYTNECLIWGFVWGSFFSDLFPLSYYWYHGLCTLQVFKKKKKKKHTETRLLHVFEYNLVVTSKQSLLFRQETEDVLGDEVKCYE